MIPAGSSWPPYIISEAHRSRSLSSGNSRAVGPACVHSAQDAGAAQSRGKHCSWARGLCREIVLRFTDRPVLVKLATAAKVCSDHCFVRRCHQTDSSERTRRNDSRVRDVDSWLIFFVVRSKPCHLLSNIYQKGRYWAGSCPALLGRYGVHSNGFVAGWARYIPRQGTGGGARCLG